MLKVLFEVVTYKSNELVKVTLTELAP